MAFYGWPFAPLACEAREEGESDLITVVVDPPAEDEVARRPTLQQVPFAFGPFKERPASSSPPNTPRVREQCSSCNELLPHALVAGPHMPCPAHQAQQQDEGQQESGTAMPDPAMPPPLSNSVTCSLSMGSTSSNTTSVAARCVISSPIADLQPTASGAAWGEQPGLSSDQHEGKEHAPGCSSGEESEGGLASHREWWGQRPSASNSLPKAVAVRGSMLRPAPLDCTRPAMASTHRFSFSGMSSTSQTQVAASSISWSSTESSTDSATADSPDTVRQHPGNPAAAVEAHMGYLAGTAAAEDGKDGSAVSENMMPDAHMLFVCSSMSEGSSTTEHSSGDTSSMDSDHKAWRKQQQRMLAEPLAVRRMLTRLHPLAISDSLGTSNSNPRLPAEHPMHRVLSLNAVSNATPPTFRRMRSLQAMSDTSAASSPRGILGVAGSGLGLTESSLLRSRASVRENVRGPRMQRWLLDSVSSAKPARAARSTQPQAHKRTWARQLHQLSRTLHGRCKRALKRAGLGLSRAHASMQYLGSSSLGTLRALGTRLMMTVGGGCVARRKAVELVGSTGMPFHSSSSQPALKQVSTGLREAAMRQLAAMDAAASAAAAASKGAEIQPASPAAKATRPFAWQDSSEEEDESDDDSSDADSAAYQRPLSHASSTLQRMSVDQASEGAAADSQLAGGAFAPWSLPHSSGMASHVALGAGGTPWPARPSMECMPTEQNTSRTFSAVPLDPLKIAHLSSPSLLSSSEAINPAALRRLLHDDQRMQVVAITLPAGFRFRGRHSNPWACTLHVLRGSVTVTLSQPQPLPGAAALLATRPAPATPGLNDPVAMIGADEPAQAGDRTQACDNTQGALHETGSESACTTSEIKPVQPDQITAVQDNETSAHAPAVVGAASESGCEEEDPTEVLEPAPVPLISESANAVLVSEADAITDTEYSCGKQNAAVGEGKEAACDDTDDVCGDAAEGEGMEKASATAGEQGCEEHVLRLQEGSIVSVAAGVQVSLNANRPCSIGVVLMVAIKA